MSYPAGIRGPEATTVDLACRNEDCGECDVVVEVDAFWELGGCFFRDEEERDCPVCGEPRA